MNSKNLYTSLLMRKYDDPLKLIIDIANDRNHIFWGCARDFATEILSKDKQWYWTVPNIDDYGLLVEENINLLKWIIWAKKGKGALSKRLTSIYDLISWLLARYVNSIKNLFDPRYSNHIRPIKFVQYDEKEL